WFWNSLLWLIGGGGELAEMTIYQLVLRTIIVYLVALLIIRVAKRRFMGGFSTFDILLAFIIGSIMARTIVGAVSLVNMVLIVGTLTLLHWAIAVISFHFQGFSDVVKNTNRKLIIDGEIQEDALRKSKIGKHDLLQAVRSQANLDSAERVRVAYLERGGDITVIPKPAEASIVEVEVEEGVQKIRICIQNDSE
ncbi:MAG: DUF421 domain-containing protein, partial [Pyrinomonadaceae bacterium]